MTGEFLQAIAPILLQKLAAMGYGTDCFFYHEVRGIKTATSHDPSDAVFRADKFLSAFKNFDRDIIEAEIADGTGSWCVDVAMEFSRTGMVVAPKLAMHNRAIRSLASIGPDESIDQLKVDGKYQSDIIAHLTDVAGFRMTFDPEANPDGLMYLNIYTTEKTPAALKDSGHYAKFLTPLEVLVQANKPGTTGMPYMRQLEAVYAECAQKKDAYAGRIEARIPYHQAVDSFTFIEEELVKSLFFDIPSATWW